MPFRNKFKLNIKVPPNVRKNEKYNEISRRFHYALVEFCTNYNIEQNTVVTHVKCRNLNYFIDNLRDEFVELVDSLTKPKKSGKTLWEEEVEKKILNKLQEETENSCARNPTHYNKEIRILRKEMEDYCDERDELIGELNSRGISEKEKCDKFRRWTLEYLVNFWNDYFWRKYITYKAMIEPFDINYMCRVITLFDNVFDCEDDGDIRFHLPARIRDKYPKTKRNFYKKKLAPTINKDKIALEDTSPKPYVETTYSANLTEEIPELGESPEITDTVFYPNISTGIQSTSVKVKDKQDSSGRNEYKGVQRVSLQTYIPHYVAQKKAASVSLSSDPVASLPSSSPSPVSSAPAQALAPAPPVQAIPQSLTGGPSKPAAGGSLVMSPPTANMQGKGGILKTASTLQIGQGNVSKGSGKSFITPPTEELSILRYSSIIPVLIGGITIFILLSKYSPLGLLFGNKKKKRHLKQTPKIAVKPPHLEKVSELVERDNLEDMIHDIPYGYRMYKIRNNVYMPKKKRNLKKTIIDIHLEVLDECQKDQWELNKRDFQEIILDVFMKDANIVCSHSSYNDSIITNMCNSEEIGKEKTLWVNWIERNKGTLEECKNEIWFNMLKSEWKQEQHEYLQKIEESEQSQLNEKKNIPLIEMQKDIWRQWVAKQHKLMEMYSEKYWFMHLLKCVEEEPNELETENSNENVSLINLEELEKQKLYQQLYKKKQLIAKLWILILSLVVEECEIEDNTNDKELYLDSFLQNLKPKRCSGEKKFNSEKICESNDIFEGNKNDETEKYKNEELFCKLNDDCINDDDDTCILANKNELDKSELILENDTSLFNEDTNKILKDNVQMKSTEDNSESDFLNVSTNNEQKVKEENKQNINVI
ncbi:STP1 protein [Plasmodium vivax]|nr:STP1 protein [Plasmodium vivax]